MKQLLLLLIASTSLLTHASDKIPKIIIDDKMPFENWKVELPDGKKMGIKNIDTLVTTITAKTIFCRKEEKYLRVDSSLNSGCCFDHEQCRAAPTPGRLTVYVDTTNADISWGIREGDNDMCEIEQQTTVKFIASEFKAYDAFDLLYTIPIKNNTPYYALKTRVPIESNIAIDIENFDDLAVHLLRYGNFGTKRVFTLSPSSPGQGQVCIKVRYRKTPEQKSRLAYETIKSSDTVRIQIVESEFRAESMLRSALPSAATT